ncbi:MAG: ATP-dependent DNA helicase RecG [Calditrichaeota bacterium]|nr:ATP-dependent DNA helicase RecG [Calditrichota bacterium]
MSTISDKSSHALTWQDQVARIRGLGKTRAEFLSLQGFKTVGDVLLRAPLRFIDRRLSPPFASLDPPPRHEIAAIGKIESFGEKYKTKRRLIVYIGDGTGYLQGVWFENYRYLIPKLTPGRLVMFTGKVTLFDGPQIVHPKITFIDDDIDLSGKTGLLPVYPSGEEWEKIGLSRRQWPRLIDRILAEWDGKGPYLPEELRLEYRLPTLLFAIKGLHKPETVEQFDIAVKAIKFVELYHHQLLMVALRRKRRSGEGIVIKSKGEHFARFIANLPFKLSDGQNQALEEIKGDFASGRPMYRLLQGEVSAGKTVVAFAAAALIADAGCQAALMAPTEILARQHYQTALRFLEPAGLKPALLTAWRDPDEIRRALFDTAVGNADILIGTHALFQKRVRIPRLGLVIIDEQQRFGVRQRAALVGKSYLATHSTDIPRQNTAETAKFLKSHVLLMTATPIPRTLALAHYGDLDLTFLPLLPGMRRQVKTRVVHESRRDMVFDWLRKELQSGRQGYLVFPVIDEGPAGLEAAEARFEPYRRIDFKGIPMALIHGRMPVERRLSAMERFRRGEVKLLAATAVIEVGVDVPEASLMVIENAERFGLAQLHQLRGRIGRLGKSSVCVLITLEQENEPGWQRLKKLETIDDGLALAEEDLKLRGAGEPLGAKQSGLVKFKMADLSLDYEILKAAHRAAVDTLDRWSDLAPFPDLREKLREEYRARPRTIFAG